MSDTEQLLAAAAIWTIISVFIARLVPNWGGRIALFAALVGLPFWELPYGYFNFQRLCTEQAKLLLFEKIEPQELVCADFPYVTLHIRLLDAGFRGVEVRGKDRGVKKYVKNTAGEVFESEQSNISSSYCMTFVNNNKLPWGILRHDVLIVRGADNNLVARQSRFDWAGMWWQEGARPILGHGGTCAGDTNQAILALRSGAN